MSHFRLKIWKCENSVGRQSSTYRISFEGWNRKGLHVQMKIKRKGWRKSATIYNWMKFETDCKANFKERIWSLFAPPANLTFINQQIIDLLMQKLQKTLKSDWMYTYMCQYPYSAGAKVINLCHIRAVWLGSIKLADLSSIFKFSSW